MVHPLTNYRPISITPTISKLFEFAVKEQILSYLLVNNLITPNQSAYLKNRSTSTALHTIIDEIASKANNGDVTALYTLDIAKGFDTISMSCLVILHLVVFDHSKCFYIFIYHYIVNVSLFVPFTFYCLYSICSNAII